MNIDLQKQYERLLTAYIQDTREDHLYGAQQLSKWILQQRVPPEEVVNFHISTLKKLLPNLPNEVKVSFDFLIEVMIGYGVAYQDRTNLVNRQRELEDEIEVAVRMQQTLLPKCPPPLKGVDIGVLSVAANRMSGDYYNFVDHGKGSLGIAISDIIGKGIPAALCMSMIKYSMDRLDDQPLSPSEVLRGLNTVVERNVDSSMFITMVYGVYDSLNHHFRYATAGHEPGLLFRASEDEFSDLETQGLVLGVEKDVDYPEYTIELFPGDAIILFSDGVTECKVDGKFLQRDQLKQIIREHLELPAQQAVEGVYQRLFEMAKYQLKDDQTIMIIKRVE
ncbi:PP2C family protein-serine/threonine phosphatase [Thermoflavimicrobium dichotomicum]|uniref:Sigma-B regulation protein RsbU (Phosphoserine phosphatase) n=1 Tax=Thermoflavimicrobium dichotomicum TaxID=46223 RepID=A0A1I3TT47_9BACL|nr:PP2C family protein-serine/threonine phosphatase [Thermoflavimicrobium dichotomicum]SFJ73509.1 sigma-B regulation protein RsbU (phosphoserine phosphatase) [Thermoflavimicrobium dichotomicum]